MTNQSYSDGQIASTCQKWASTCIETMAKLTTLAYDKASVEWLDGYIERNRQVFKKMQNSEGIVNIIGAFLGECIIRNYGGKWTQKDSRWGVEIGTLTAFPFDKVEKQINGDSTDSIFGFYQVTGTIYNNPDFLNRTNPSSE